jgi:transposase
MPIVAPLVADSYDLLVGVDTHAGTHTFALLDATTGALLDNREFPTNPAGLRRALAWLVRRVEDRSCLVVVDGAGSYGAILTERLATDGHAVAEAPGIPAHVRRKSGKTDSLDAAEIARATRGLADHQLRRPRSSGDRAALRILTTARDQMSGERTRAVNALTALLRTNDLGVDARRALSHKKIATIAAWRTPSSSMTTIRAVSRAEAVRLARRIRVLDSDLAANRVALTAAVAEQAPELLQVRGVGPVVAASVLHAWSHPGRIHSEAAFAALAGGPVARLFRGHPPPPAQPRRRSPAQPRPLHRRPDPARSRPTHPRLPRPPHRRGLHPTRDHPRPQALMGRQGEAESYSSARP